MILLIITTTAIAIITIKMSTIVMIPIITTTTIAIITITIST